MAKRFASREVANLVITDYATKQPVLMCDYANTTTTEMTSSSVYARGGWNAPKLVAFNGEIDATFTIETQMTSFQVYQLMTGADVFNDAKFIMREVHTAVAGSITLDDTPIAGTVFVFPVDDDCGTAVAPKSVSENTKTVTMNDSSDNNTYVIYYQKQLSDVKRLNIKSSKFGKDVTIYGETLTKLESGELIPYKMVIYKATPQTNITLEFQNQGDPTTTTLVFDVLSDGDKNMIDLILDSENA